MPTQAGDALAAPGGLVVGATKVGYVLMATDSLGLKRKLDAKHARGTSPVSFCAPAWRSSPR
jgi:hypothetical protein